MNDKILRLPHIESSTLTDRSHESEIGLLPVSYRNHLLESSHSIRQGTIVVADLCIISTAKDAIVLTSPFMLRPILSTSAAELLELLSMRLDLLL